MLHFHIMLNNIWFSRHLHTFGKQNDLLTYLAMAKLTLTNELCSLENTSQSPLNSPQDVSIVVEVNLNILENSLFMKLRQLNFNNWHEFLVIFLNNSKVFVLLCVHICHISLNVYSKSFLCKKSNSA